MRLWAVAIGVLGCAVVGCTDTGVHRFPGNPPDAPDTTVEVEGTYCASDPQELLFPVKILFVLDDSGSMGNSDPNFQRIQAAGDLVNALIVKPAIYFGVERFQGGQAQLLTSAPTFTRDGGALANALNPGQHGPNGATPYVSALSTAVTAIRNDIQANPVDAKNTRYVVLFLSDGVPTDDNQPYSQILATTQQLKALESGSPSAGAVTLHTAYLEDAGANQDAINLLTQMAQIGDGEFRNFENGDQIDFSDFDVTAISRDYRSYFPILVSNMSTRPTRQGLMADSDLDGLNDAEEDAIGTDSGSMDTDHDGCSDVMEYRYADWDPLVHGDQTSPTECSCTQAERIADKDADGLTDCEEKWLSLDPLNPDSDINADGNPAPDNMLDRFEVIWNLGRTKWDANEDYDVDGVSNMVELATHMDPNTNDNDMRDQFAYRYEYVNQQLENPRCYDFRVTNVHVVDTRAADGRSPGENLIMLYFIEAPQDNPFGESVVRSVERIVRFTGGEPDPKKIRIEPDQFTILGENP